MWPFYTICLRMRVLGVSRATQTHACFMCNHLDHILYCNLYSWNLFLLMAMLSLFLDLFKSWKKNTFLSFMFLYTENVNTVSYITYKDNEHSAVKCIVLHSLGVDIWKDASWHCLCKYVGVFKPTTPLLLPWSPVSICNFALRSIWSDTALCDTPASIIAPSEGWRT